MTFRRAHSTTLRLALIAALAYSLAACPNPAGPATGSIAGHALYGGQADSSGIIITAESTDGVMTQSVKRLLSKSSAEIKSIAAQATTDAQGAYLLSDLPAGTYTIYASSNSSLEKAVAVDVVVEEGKTVTAMDLSLTATGNIAGGVTIEGATTGNLGIVVFVAGTSYSAITSDGGSYTISDVPVGLGYVVYASKPGYESSSGNADVTAGGTAALSFNLVSRYEAAWAQSATVGPSASQFSSVVVDGNWNVYAVGYIDGTGTYNFGGGGTATGTSSGHNALLAKYSPIGTAQWAKTVSSGTNASFFSTVTVDANGSVFAAGSIFGTGTIDFGGSTTATGTSASNNPVLVKYNSSGSPQWAKTLTAGTGGSQFYAVAIEPGGDIYAAGYLTGTGTYNFGGSGSATGAYAGNNALLVKYDPSGTALWARTVVMGAGDSNFNSVSVDSSGSVYVVGAISGTGSYDFGGSGTATGASNGSNAVLVKYDYTGTAQWARTVVTGTGNSAFTSVALSDSGDIYAGGIIGGTGTYSFGGNGAAAGTYSLGSNVVLVKYNSSGSSQWARTTVIGPGNSVFAGVSVDTIGNIYVVGQFAYTGTWFFGGSGIVSGGSGGNNPVLVKYNPSGTAQLARTSIAGIESCAFLSVSVDTDGNAYAAGTIVGPSTHNFGGSGRASGPNVSSNALIVHYSRE